MDELPTGPGWICDIVQVTGDRVGPDGRPLTEEAEVWRRDPVACVMDLIGNAALQDFIVYEPVRVKRDGQRYYGEMNTADWWWDVQVGSPWTNMPHTGLTAGHRLVFLEVRLSPL